MYASSRKDVKNTSFIIVFKSRPFRLISVSGMLQVRYYHLDDWGSMHLWNVGQLQHDYTTLHPRRLYKLHFQVIDYIFINHMSVSWL
jgi:hypothetical protein